MEDEGLPSELLFGIYKFLTENDLKKAAKALRKEVSLDAARDSDVNLLEMYRKYLKRKRKSVNSLDFDGTNKKFKFTSEEVLQTSEPTALETDVVWEIEEPFTPIEGNAITKQKKKKKKSNAKDNSTVFVNKNNNLGFRRVNIEMSNVNPMLRDNSFAKKVKMGGSDKNWGKKACDDFKNTAGKTFRHEKTKKKRGSYRGGAISTEVCSFKFDVSEDSD